MGQSLVMILMIVHESELGPRQENAILSIQIEYKVILVEATNWRISR